MLLNELFKEHRKVENLKVTVAEQRKDYQSAIAQQQNQINALTAALKTQSAQIRR